MHHGSAALLDLLGIVTHQTALKNLEAAVGHDMSDAQPVGVQQVVERLGGHGSDPAQEAADIDRAQVGLGPRRNTADIVPAQSFGCAQGCALNRVPDRGQA